MVPTLFLNESQRDSYPDIYIHKTGVIYDSLHPGAGNCVFVVYIVNCP